MLRLILRIPTLYYVLAFLFARRVLVRGWSMYPSLVPGEHVLFDRVAYLLSPPARGDIVLAYHPEHPKMPILKRVVAIPGDKVRLAGEECWINGLLKGAENPLGEVEIREGEWTMSKDEYFLLGDYHQFSTDSRHFGPVPREGILGRAWLVYWPPSHFRTLSPEQNAKVNGLPQA